VTIDATPFVSVIVPTFRRPDVLGYTLDALLHLDYPHDLLEVIVVDDGSGDDTHEVVRRREGQSVEVIYVDQENSGVARARNNGAARARGEILIFVDDDILVEPDHVSRHLAARSAGGPMLVNGHWEFEPHLRTELESTPFGRFRIAVEDWVRSNIVKEPLECGRFAPSAVTACNLSVDAESFRAIGGFDETFPYAGCEDQELARRAARFGARLIYDPGIRLLHNDHRVELRQFCERQRRGAITAVHLASRAPEEFGRRMLEENGPFSRSDPPTRTLKKLSKWLLSRKPVLAAIEAAVLRLERCGASERILRRAYWSITGLYIFRGVQEGFVRLDGRS